MKKRERGEVACTYLCRAIEQVVIPALTSKAIHSDMSRTQQLRIECDFIIPFPGSMRIHARSIDDVLERRPIYVVERCACTNSSWGDGLVLDSSIFVESMVILTNLHSGWVCLLGGIIYATTVRSCPDETTGRVGWISGRHSPSGYWEYRAAITKGTTLSEAKIFFSFFS